MTNKPKVTILGSFVVDLMARTPHLPIPGETVKGSMFRIGSGGKGTNQGIAANRTGSEVSMITKIGNDDFSGIAVNSFKNEGMDCSYLYQDPNSSTGTALILVDEISSQNSIVVTLGACEKITPDEIENARQAIEKADVLLVQLETNIDAVEYAIRLANKAGVRVILNPAPVQSLSDDLLAKVNILIPNEVEARALAGFELQTENDIQLAAQRLLDKGIENVIITLGGRGAIVATQEAIVRMNAFNVTVVDTTGAGDAFCGAFATAYAEGLDIVNAARFASAAAALSVTRIGTAPSMPYRHEVEDFLFNYPKGEY
jgi:ribokinase